MTYKNIALALAFAVTAGGCTPGQPGKPFTTPLHLPYLSSFSESPPDSEVPNGWHLWQPARFKKATEYRLVELDGRKVVEARAEASASGLVHPLGLDPADYPLLSWEWKVSELIPGADNTRREAEDSPVRVIVTFDGNTEKLPLEERIFADNFRLITGQPLPYATLMYIWENRAAPGTIIQNHHTTRIKMIVAASGSEGLGTWQRVTRNIVEDYWRAFGEWPGTIAAVAIMTDTDNTGETISAHYGDIVLRHYRGRGTLADAQ